MKVKIGPYIEYFGPVQLAEKLLFWKDKEDACVHSLGNFFAYGTLTTKEHYPLDEDIDAEKTWLYKLLEWVYNKRQRKIVVKIDPYDTWSMDTTLAHIIVPMLKQLKATKHGSPLVDNKDVPAELHAASTDEGGDIDTNWHKRWDWVMDEMIWAFEQIATDPDVAVEEYKEHYARINRGTALFGKYYQGLWD